MRNLTIVIIAMAFLAGCGETRGQRAATGALAGAAGGAAIGAIAGGGRGAAIGAVAGGASGAIIGAVVDRPGYCHARDRFGNRVVVRCPR